MRQMKRITKEPGQRACSLRGKMGPSQKCKVEVSKGHKKVYSVEVFMGEGGLLKLWRYTEFKDLYLDMGQWREQ